MRRTVTIEVDDDGVVSSDLITRDIQAAIADNFKALFDSGLIVVIFSYSDSQIELDIGGLDPAPIATARYLTIKEIRWATREDHGVRVRFEGVS